MKAEEKEEADPEVCEVTVDLSKQSLRKIERATSEQKPATVLILDDNELQKLENLDSYKNIKKLSAVNNQLFRMYGVSPATCLETLDLSCNSLVTIEGLKDLKELKHLILAKNRIKSIEHLNRNLKLEKIDLSKNYISHLSDISFLQNLQELRLSGNKISHLQYSEKKLPKSIEILTLDNNCINDLNEISHLSELTSLKEFSFENNPCLRYGSCPVEFNYRPFVKNWCSSLIVLDNCPLDDIECLKAEWLYSQGKGRSFRSGEHAALVDYLMTVCPKKAEKNDEEDDKKLKLILSKAQQHQQQLREQLSLVNISSPESQKSHQSRRKGGTALPERMVTSFQDSSVKNSGKSSEFMTLSLDSAMMKSSPTQKTHRVSDASQTPLQTSTTFIPIPDSLISPDVSHSLYPLASCNAKSFSTSCRTSRSSSRNSLRSTPDSKRKILSTVSGRMNNDNSSPDNMKKPEKQEDKISRSNTPVRRNMLSRSSSSPSRRGNKLRDFERKYKETSEDEDSESVPFKCEAIQRRINQRAVRHVIKKERKEVKESKEIWKKPENQFVDSKAWKAAVCIQRHWRGYKARNLSGEVLNVCRSIQMNRIQDYITKVVKDMEATRLALEGNRKLQVLQMQAINALWKKMVAFQKLNESPERTNESKTRLQFLMETCSTLNKQVEGLQEMVKAMQNTSTALIPMATQTEIVAVRTPQDEAKNNFPYVVENAVSEGGNVHNSTSVQNVAQEEVDEPVDLIKLENGTPLLTEKAIFELYSNSKVKETTSREEFCSSCTDSSERGKLVAPSLTLDETLREALSPSKKEKEPKETEEKSEIQNVGCHS